MENLLHGGINQRSFRSPRSEGDSTRSSSPRARRALPPRSRCPTNRRVDATPGMPPGPRSARMGTLQCAVEPANQPLHFGLYPPGRPRPAAGGGHGAPPAIQRFILRSHLVFWILATFTAGCSWLLLRTDVVQSSGSPSAIILRPSVVRRVPASFPPRRFRPIWPSSCCRLPLPRAVAVLAAQVEDSPRETFPEHGVCGSTSDWHGVLLKYLQIRRWKDRTFSNDTPPGALLSAIPRKMCVSSSAVDVTRICRRNVRAILPKSVSTRFSQEPCLGV